MAMLVTVAASLASAGRLEEPGEGRERLAAFGEWFQRSLDFECSGWAPVARLVEIMNPGRSRPRQMNWVMALDGDGDGFVEPGEVGVGLWKNLEEQVERRMHGDVDGDGVLSPREYALFVPDPGAETNEDRLSALQERRFAALDHNGDRRISRNEVEDDFAGSYLALHWSRMLLFHFGRADADGDGAVSRNELTRAIRAAGGSGTPAALAGWFEAAARENGDSSASRLVLARLPALLQRAGADAADRRRPERALGPLVAPPCHTSANGSP